MHEALPPNTFMSLAEYEKASFDINFTAVFFYCTADLWNAIISSDVSLFIIAIEGAMTNY